MRVDPALKPLREESKFKELLAAIDAANEASRAAFKSPK
jgi:hypothetical protein